MCFEERVRQQDVIKGPVKQADLLREHITVRIKMKNKRRMSSSSNRRRGSRRVRRRIHMRNRKMKTIMM